MYDSEDEAVKPESKVTPESVEKPETEAEKAEENLEAKQED